MLIIITSSFGEIFKVEFKPEENFKPIVTLISEYHKNVIFSIACSLYVRYQYYNLKCKFINKYIFSISESTKPYLWSSCVGRKLIRIPLFDTDNNDDLPLEVPTFNGYVYCITLSPANTSK